ncbi:MAG: FAD-dependent oxidoreductase [Deltaproteobacteria bacterium]|nr:FAD-dependent oxidoreductase [Deltaproteobacteria bacterium]
MSNENTQRLVVVGGDAAGMSAASQAKRRNPDLDVVVLEQGDFISYAACGMPYMISGAVAESDSLLVLKPETARKRRGLDVRMRHRVLGIDVKRKVVQFEDLEQGRNDELPYGSCVVATGAVPIVPSVPGVNLDGVMTLRSFESGLVIRKAMADHVPKRSVVVGSGLVGLEMAEALTSLGSAVTILKRTGDAILGLYPELAEVVAEELARNGCTLLMKTALEGLEGTDRVEMVLGGGEVIPADFVLLAVGVQPASDLAREAGMTLGVKGAIAVDEHMETSAAGVFAAGDCVDQVHGVSGEKVFVPQALSANRQGRVAGANAGFVVAGSSNRLTNPPVYSTFVTKVFGLEVARTGLTMADAQRVGLDAGIMAIKASSRAHYYPGSAPLHVAVLYEKGTGRLLGAQMVGSDGVAKRIDTFVTALSAGMDLEAVSRLDLAYAPPFAPVWDPVLVAVNVAKKRV